MRETGGGVGWLVQAAVRQLCLIYLASYIAQSHLSVVGRSLAADLARTWAAAAEGVAWIDEQHPILTHSLSGAESSLASLEGEIVESENTGGPKDRRETDEQ